MILGLAQVRFSLADANIEKNQRPSSQTPWLSSVQYGHVESQGRAHLARVMRRLKNLKTIQFTGESNTKGNMRQINPFCRPIKR